MKKLVILFVLIFSFAAFAQTDEVSTQETTMTEMSEMHNKTHYIGVKVGQPLGVQYGMRNIFSGADLRLRATTALIFGLTLNGGADLLFHLTDIPLESGLNPLHVYAGPSLDFTVAFTQDAQAQAQNLFGITPGAIAGLEYDITPEISVFGELGVGYTVIFQTIENLNFNAFRPSFSFGLNYNF
ncbi:MAG: hypothetical protein R2880_18230 [Deinococcales bacterium]